MGPMSWPWAIPVETCFQSRDSLERHTTSVRSYLFNPIDRLDGRVVGSDGKGVSDAVVFSRGAHRETVETLTDASGQFRLESLRPQRGMSLFAKTDIVSPASRSPTTPTP